MVYLFSKLRFSEHEKLRNENRALPYNQKLEELADKYRVPVSAAAVAWILRHPAHFQVLVGSMNPQHLSDACKGSGIKLTRVEWFELYKSAGNPVP